jgi:acetyltransferase-like isoleucine patch superfamily enzyme
VQSRVEYRREATTLIGFSHIDRRLRREFRVLKAITTFRANRVSYGRRPAMEYARVVIENEGSIVVGDRCFFQSIESRTLLRTAPNAELRIGSHAFVNAGVSITAVERIVIGDWVKIGQNVAITDTGGHEIVAGEGIRTGSVNIGSNVWIGRGVLILPGVSIGDNAVIGAGAVVGIDVPANWLAVGVPARLKRELPPSTAPRK